MTGKTHLLIGIITGIAIAVTTNASINDALLLTGAAAIGSLVPDIDSPNSMITRRVRPVRLLIFWIPHRTLTHSVIALAAVGAAALMLGIFAVSFAAGYASHIAADMTTRNGVPLFYPLWGRRLHLLPPGFRLMTGGLIESLFATGCTVGIFVLIAQFLGVVTWTN